MRKFLEIFEIDSYELGARYIPALIFELLLVYSFKEKLIFLNLQTLKELNEIFPLSVYFPILILIFLFPVKAILRLIGEIVENIIWLLKHPTITYISYRVKNTKNIIIDLKNCPGEKNLKELIENKECHRFLIEFLKTKTRNDKKLKSKLIEHGFFRNMFAGFLLLFFIDILFIHKYWKFYLFSSFLFFIGMIIYSYYSYPKQLINSYLERSMQDDEQN